MTPEQDAYGRMLLDHLDGADGTHEVTERDDGFVSVSEGASYYAAPFAEWPGFEREAIRRAVGRVLDVGAGAGRAALHLQNRGREVVAIDNSPGAVEVCRRRGVADVREMPVTRVSRALGGFDTVLLFGNNLGLLAGARRGRWLLRRFHTMTPDRGRIVATTLDPYLTDDPDHLAYHERNRHRGRLGGQIRLRVRYRRLVTPWFDYLFVSRDELRALVDGTGWRIDRLIDSGGPLYAAVLTKDG